MTNLDELLQTRFFFPFFFSFKRKFSLLIRALYHQTKTPISFWCRQELNPRSLIQPSETLPVELTGTHTKKWTLKMCFLRFFYFFFEKLSPNNYSLQLYIIEDSNSGKVHRFKQQKDWTVDSPKKKKKIEIGM